MTLYIGVDLLDGARLIRDAVVRVENGIVTKVGARSANDRGIDLSVNGNRALVCPGLIDLQVNGGGGLMLGDCNDVGDVARLVQAHQTGGVCHLMPTLISDSIENTKRIIKVMAQAEARNPMIVGLHLEGPHIHVAGAHNPAHLRPMTADDVALYLYAAQRLPRLMITLAPECATLSQIRRLSQAGVIVSLGHSACDYDMASAAFHAGAHSATHLFNAMGGMHHRTPGLVGAALDQAPFIGLIADGHHVHPAMARMALRARPGAIYPVSDAMAVAGTDADAFTLAGRRVPRANGRLMLDDGTLAGADLTLWQAVRTIAAWENVSLHTALKYAFDTPHRLLYGTPNIIETGKRAHLNVIQGQKCLPLPNEE